MSTNDASFYRLVPSSVPKYENLFKWPKSRENAFFVNFDTRLWNVIKYLPFGLKLRNGLRFWGLRWGFKLTLAFTSFIIWADSVNLQSFDPWASIYSNKLWTFNSPAGSDESSSKVRNMYHNSKRVLHVITQKRMTIRLRRPLVEENSTS